MVFGKSTLEQFFLEGSTPCRRDTMLKQIKSVRRKKQERENCAGLTVTPHSPSSCSTWKGKAEVSGMKE